MAFAELVVRDTFDGGHVEENFLAAASVDESETSVSESFDSTFSDYSNSKKSVLQGA